MYMIDKAALDTGLTGLKAFRMAQHLAALIEERPDCDGSRRTDLGA
ncbi:hypothetical protein [Sphingomonas endolithica]|nr:hypothetical protein [Sphingomonas sp. ZFBP2030]